MKVRGKKNLAFVRWILGLLALVFIMSSVSFALDYRKGDWSDLDELDSDFRGREKEERVIDAFFAEREKWEDHYACMLFWLFKHTDYPKYTSTRLLPFWYSKTSKIDNRSLTWFLLYYRETDGPWERRLFFPLYQSTTDTSRNSADRTLLYLYWWGGKSESSREESYHYFIPLVFHNASRVRDGTDRESSLLFIPLLYRSGKESHNQEYGNGNAEEFNISLLHFYYSKTSIYQNKPENNRVERLWGFPIIPLIYYHAEPGYTHFNFLWLTDHIWDKGKLRHSWVFPLWFLSPGNDGYTHILPPIFISLRWPSGEYYWHLFPLALKYRLEKTDYDQDEPSAGKNVDNAVFSLLFSRFTTTKALDKSDPVVTSDTFWYPIIPLYYSSYDKKEGTHRNLFWLIDWHVDSEKRLSRFWFMPVFFYKNEKSTQTLAEKGDEPVAGNVYLWPEASSFQQGKPYQCEEAPGRLSTISRKRISSLRESEVGGGRFSRNQGSAMMLA